VTTAFRNILLEQPEPGIYLLTVNRPKALNALNAATLDEIATAIGKIAADDAARVLLVTGAGKKALERGVRSAGESKAISLNCRAKAAISRCYNALPGARWFERRLHVMSCWS